MNHSQLETFIRVADAGSFNKAAEEVYITPTAVIKQINLLEADLGIELFERTHRGIILTKAGQSFYNDAKYIIQYCRDSITRAKNAMQDNDIVIRIGTSSTTPAQALVELWSKIHSYCPEVKFQLIPFENTPENAREILKNLGQNIDVVAGIFDDFLLDYRQCKGLPLTREPICCAVSLDHPLAAKNKLEVKDLYGENFMMMRRGWSRYVDELRDDLWANHPQINIVDFHFYDVDIFNRCENSRDILMAVGIWENIHPFLKIIPVEWNYTIPYGLLHSPQPSEKVQTFLSAAQAAIQE